MRTNHTIAVVICSVFAPGFVSLFWAHGLAFGFAKLKSLNLVQASDLFSSYSPFCPSWMKVIVVRVENPDPLGNLSVSIEIPNRAPQVCCNSGVKSEATNGETITKDSRWYSVRRPISCSNRFGQKLCTKRGPDSDKMKPKLFKQPTNQKNPKNITFRGDIITRTRVRVQKKSHLRLAVSATKLAAFTLPYNCFDAPKTGQYLCAQMNVENPGKIKVWKSTYNDKKEPKFGKPLVFKLLPLKALNMTRTFLNFRILRAYHGRSGLFQRKDQFCQRQVAWWSVYW